MNFTLNNAANWQTIDLEGIGNDIITIYANFSVISVYPDHHVYQKYIQFRELKVFGQLSGMGYNANVTNHYRSRTFDISLVVKMFFYSFQICPTISIDQ